MERLVVFLLCFAFAYGGAANSSTSVLKPSMTVTGSNTTGTVQASTKTTKHVVVVTTTPVKNATVTPHHMSATVKPSNASSTRASSSIRPFTEPPAKPTYGDYDVQNKDKKYCLLAEMKVSLHVTYEIKKTSENQTATKNKTVIPMPIRNANFLMDGSTCGPKKSTLVVNWPTKDQLFKLAIEFSLFESASTNVSSWNISQIKVDINTANNPYFLNPKDNKISFMGSTAKMGSVGGRQDQLYQCPTLTYQFSDKSNNSLELSVDNAKFQPFEVTSKNFTGKVEKCYQPTQAPSPTSSHDSDIVPIAVGCALAGLVLIVLIAYIIGRRKSQRGYEKV